MVGGAGRNRVRRAAGSLDVVDRLFPALLEADAEAGLHEPHVGAHDAAQHDVADAVVDDVRPVHPALLHEHAAEPEVGRDGGDLARVVRLHAADRDERVAALRERVGDEVLELARLVAAEREPGVAVVALGPDRGAAQVLRQPLEPVDGRRAEGQRIAREVVEQMPRHSTGGKRAGNGRRITCRTPPVTSSVCSLASASARVAWIVTNVVRPAIFIDAMITSASPGSRARDGDPAPTCADTSRRSARSPSSRGTCTRPGRRAGSCARSRARAHRSAPALDREIVLATQRGDADVGRDALHLDRGPSPARPFSSIRSPASRYGSPACASRDASAGQRVRLHGDQGGAAC